MSISATSAAYFPNRAPLAVKPKDPVSVFGAALESVSTNLPIKTAGTPKTAPAVETIVSLDGTVWTKTDMAAALTSEDKQILGWPSSDPATNMLAAMVASDRTDGSLQGRMTNDYVTGNRSRNIAGLIDRQPAEVMDKQRIWTLLDRITNYRPL